MSSGFPGGSKGRVNKAGDRVSVETQTDEDLFIIDEWRSAHKAVLNTFQASLRMRTQNTEVVVAQRHKRKNTIFDKLNRYPGMKLSRMDDVAGCRLIFPDIETLQNFRDSFHKAKFKHHLKNDPDKYNYITNPKGTGYRGIHDVYEYDVRSSSNAHLKGLLIELQYRTKIQHAWATTVEVIGHITNSQPKFERGDERYQRAMVYASEILARAHEDMPGPVPGISNKELIDLFDEVDSDIHLTRSLGGLNQVKTIHSEKKNVILIFDKAGNLSIESYTSASEALIRLFDIEKKNPDLDVVLVRADTSDEVRFAYKNYFSDATDFLTLLRQGKKKIGSRTRRFTGRTGMRQ
jgi:ppGpp synthetase/RelA/SpoT-type nucleotidyltranferase